MSLKNKRYSALVAEVREEIDLAYKAKPIISIIDKNILVIKTQLKLWQWMADYYCCTTCEVMNVAMPSGLNKLQSGTKVASNGVGLRYHRRP